MAKAVFLDRDGVINRAIVRKGKPYPPDSLAELELLPGVKVAVERLKLHGFLIVVVTNQPDVGAGRQKRGIVEALHARLMAELPLDAIKVCYHIEGDGCACRKPKPGMLLEAATDYDIDLARSYLVGDRWRDVAAARAAGCQSYFIDYGYREKRPEKPYVAVKSLLDAASRILNDSSLNRPRVSA
jgi:D-glycero-D-manno-heptose 1,7-bisphosphate phosphatase